MFKPSLDHLERPQREVKFKKGWGCSSAVQSLAAMRQALGAIPTATKKNAGKLVAGSGVQWETGCPTGRRPRVGPQHRG